MRADPDLIRVGRDFFMVSTPFVVIKLLKSKDKVKAGSGRHSRRTRSMVNGQTGHQTGFRGQ